MELLKINRKLIGPINASGSSGVDYDRSSNLDDHINLISDLVEDLSFNSGFTKAPEDSVRKIAEKTVKGLQEIRDNITAMLQGIENKKVLSEGLDLVSKEREEQIKKHGYTITHDMKYTDGQLLDAVVSIIDQDLSRFPFENDYFNMIMVKTPEERLAIAGALICAEIDRLKKTEDISSIASKHK